MNAYPVFDLSKLIGGLETLRPIARDGNRVTYDSFLFMGTSSIVEVKNLVVEFPPQSIRIEQTSVDNQGVTFTASTLAPRIVSVEFGKLTPINWDTAASGR